MKPDIFNRRLTALEAKQLGVDRQETQAFFAKLSDEELSQLCSIAEKKEAGIEPSHIPHVSLQP
jgi:hypothetical protein